MEPVYARNKELVFFLIPSPVTSNANMLSPSSQTNRLGETAESGSRTCRGWIHAYALAIAVPTSGPCIACCIERLVDFVIFTVLPAQNY